MGRIFVGLVVVAILVVTVSCGGSNPYKPPSTAVEVVNTPGSPPSATTPVSKPTPVGSCVQEIRNGEVTVGDRFRITPVPDNSGKDQALNLIARLEDIGKNAVITSSAARGPYTNFQVDPAAIAPTDQVTDPVVFAPVAGMVGRLVAVQCGEVPILKITVSFWDICHRYPDASLAGDAKPKVLDYVKATYRVDPCNIGMEK